MSEQIVSSQGTKDTTSEKTPVKQETKPAWQTPKLEDVSEQVMAQPYIRFT